MVLGLLVSDLTDTVLSPEALLVFIGWISCFRLEGRIYEGLLPGTIQLILFVHVEDVELEGQ